MTRIESIFSGHLTVSRGNLATTIAMFRSRCSGMSEKIKKHRGEEVTIILKVFNVQAGFAVVLTES